MLKTGIRLVYMISFILIVPFGQSCDLLSSIPEQIPATRDALVAAIEEASREIRSGLDIETALLKVDEALQKVDQTIFYSIPWIIQHTLVETTAASLCVEGILEDKAIYYLAKLKAEIITGEEVTPPPPRICGSSFYVLDLNSPVTRIVKFAGEFYDNVKEDISAYLIKGEERLQLTNMIRFQGPNAFTLNLTSFSDEFLGDFDYLSIQAEDMELYAMSIIPKEAEPPVKETIRYPFPTISVLGRRCGEGDLEFNGGPEVNIKIWFRRTRNQIFVHTDFDAIRRKNNGSVVAHACALDETSLYKAPEGKHIEDVYSATLDFSKVYHISYIDNDLSEDPFHLPWGLIMVTGDAEGIDVNSSTGLVMNFTQAVQITLAEGN